MGPLFVAVEKFDPSYGETWDNYICCFGLRQLDEVVSLDGLLCPTVLPETKDDYWPHIVQADFMTQYFTDLDFLLKQIEGIERFNLLSVYLNPECPPTPLSGAQCFELLGYDLIEVAGSISALTNCGGFPEAFSNSELSSKGLINSYKRAVEIQSALRIHYPEEPHADCNLWAISRAI